MIKKHAIDVIKNKLIATYRPLKIYLFGSYAWGTPTEESDLDFLVIVSRSTKQSYERAVKGYHALRELTIPKDILVMTKQEFDEMSKDVTTLCHKTKHEGKLLYAKPWKMVATIFRYPDFEIYPKKSVVLTATKDAEKILLFVKERIAHKN